MYTSGLFVYFRSFEINLFLNFLGPSHYDRSETTKKFDADDEDLDAMINSLKQKTSGRQGR